MAGTGVDPLTALITLGGGLLGGLFSPETPQPQQLQSYASGGQSNPITLLNKALGNADALGERLNGESFSLPDAFVSPVPGYSGGALPMRIGGFGVPANLTSGIDESAVVRRKATAPAASPVDSVKAGKRQTARDVRRAQPEQAGDLARPRGGGPDEALTALDMLRTRDWVGPRGR